MPMFRGASRRGARMSMAHPGETGSRTSSPCIEHKAAFSRKSRESTLLFTCRGDGLPRLCREDLGEPERFHQRLTEWILRQR